jgi:hypothetical protein
MSCERCDDVGHREGEWCDCPAAERARAAALAEWDWMAPLARRYNQLRREGLDDEAEALERMVLAP